jgi:hypothetical protein
MLRDRIPHIVAVGAAAFNIAIGLWAFFDPQSFFDEIALFTPYNEHFLHDVGAFQIGIGATLLLALVWKSDALLAALAGVGIGSVLHVVAHLTDTDLGGRDSDPVFLGVLAAAIVGAAVWKWATRSQPPDAR